MVDVKKLGGLLGLMTGAAAVTPDEAEAAVYSKDGRRLLNLLDKASKGALPMTEPVFEFQERLPKDIFKAAREDNGAFRSRKLAAAGKDIQHYWDARHGHMSNEEIEDLVESLTTGKDRFYVRANKPYAESVGTLGNVSGGSSPSIRGKNVSPPGKSHKQQTAPQHEEPFLGNTGRFRLPSFDRYTEHARNTQRACLS